MKAKKFLKDSELFDLFNPIRDAMCNFACYLDIPQYRIVFLDKCPELGYDVKASDNLLWWLYRRFEAAFGVPVVYFKHDAELKEAIYKLIRNISTRNDRIVACRQIMRFPMELAVIDNMDPALDGNARYVAKVVYYALEAITKRMSELAEANKPKGGKE